MVTIASAGHTKPGSFAEAAYDVAAGLRVGIGHAIHHGAEFIADTFIKPIAHPLGITFEGEKPEPSDGIKVVGVGYGRTGTYSLTLALEELGFPTLHTQHMYEHQDVLDMWVNEIYLPSIKAKKVELGNPNFDTITQAGFEATMDLPMALYFEQIHEKYPDCKFILTTRDNSDTWFRSWDMLTKSITVPVHYFGFVHNARQMNSYFRWLFAIVNNDNSYLTAPTPLPDQNREAAIASYEQHNRRVREVIPSNLLLEYNVKQGWEPLCDFLEIEECPTTPFPRANNARSLQAQTISGMLIPLTLALFVIFWLFSVVFQRATGKTVVQWVNCKLVEMKQYLTKMKKMA